MWWLLALRWLPEEVLTELGWEHCVQLNYVQEIGVRLNEALDKLAWANIA